MNANDAAVSPSAAPAATPAVAPAAASAAAVEQVKAPKVWWIILVALIAIIFTAVWLGVYEWLNKTIWQSSFMTTNRWALPIGVLFFSLLVGLAQKYLHAPTVIHGGALESLKNPEEEKNSRIPFLGTLVSSYGSLLSGASVGPEGSLGFLVSQIATWMHRRLNISKESAPGFDMAALASGYNGIIGSPLFTGVLATDLRFGGNLPAYLVWNLLAGVIGYLFFTLLGLPVFAEYIPFPPISEINLTYVVWAIVLGVVGAVLAILTGLLLQVFGTAIGKAFNDRAIPRILFAGVVISIVGYFFPEVLFAGETQIFPMIENPAAYGVAMLLFLGILKLVMLALAFKTGYIGGPTFPILFACTMWAMALSLLFPSVPVSIFVTCIEAAAISLVLRAPLAAILLVAVVGTADPYTIALLVLSSVVGMAVGGAVTRLISQRAAQRQAATTPS